jgi:hypothetical protein
MIFCPDGIDDKEDHDGFFPFPGPVEVVHPRFVFVPESRQGSFIETQYFFRKFIQRIFNHLMTPTENRCLSNTDRKKDCQTDSEYGGINTDIEA